MVSCDTSPYLQNTEDMGNCASLTGAFGMGAPLLRPHKLQCLSGRLTDVDLQGATPLGCPDL